MFKRIVVPTVMYWSETRGMGRVERNKVDVSEMQCLRSMCGVTRWNRMRNVVVRERVGVTEEMSKRVDRKVLKWFGHVELMGDRRLTKRVYMLVVRRAWEGHLLGGWMKRGARVPREIGIEAAKKMGRDRNETDRVV